MLSRSSPFNPLDLLLYAGDEARRGAGLAPADIFAVLECSGRIDLPGMSRAIHALHKAYPVTRAALHTSSLTGRPSWRLDADSPEIDQVLRVGQSTEDCAELLERLFTERVDWRSGPPLRFYVLHGPSDDVVVLRWPHFLMDARGGVILIEEMAALHEQGSDPGAIVTRGDERRRDFGGLGSPPVLLAQLRLQRGARGGRPAHWRDLRLGSCSGPGAERIRLELRRLGSRSARDVADAAMRVCGFGRFADFIRAAAIRALHETIGSPNAGGAGYSTLHLIDNRKRRDRGPACHNVFSTLPIYVPSSIAGETAAVADLIHERTRQAWASDLMRRRLAGLSLLARVPTRMLVSRLRRRLRTAARGGLPLGVANAPSLPLGFLGPFSRATPRFCGAPLVNLFGARPPIPSAGFALSVNAAQDRMNLAMVYYEPRIAQPQARELLERLAAALSK
jgi:hypothetical protein